MQGKYIEYSGDNLFSEISNKKSVTIYYLVRSIYDFRHLGYYAVNLDYSKFDFLKETIQKDVSIIITDEKDNLVLSNIGDKYDMPINMIKGVLGEVNIQEGNMVYFNTLMNGHWNIWIIKENSSLLETYKFYLYTFVILRLQMKNWHWQN